MIQLTSEDLTAGSLTHLDAIQQEINGEATFEGKIVKAKSEWKTKQSTLAARASFAEIKRKLIGMCSGAEICVYCEHNEATDIEHIFPKRLYPSKCFLWDNYVLACGKCNTHFKREAFAIFVPDGSQTLQDISPKPKDYIEPENEDALFINQRIEDPMYYLELDFLGKTFYYIEKQESGTRDYQKAKFTKDLLGLNRRDDLVKHRIATFKYYKSELETYAAIQNAGTMAELSQSVDHAVDNLNEDGEFEAEKARILALIKERIQKHSHPTIWKEMIRQRENLPETNHLFQQIPDALTW